MVELLVVISGHEGLDLPLAVDSSLELGDASAVGGKELASVSSWRRRPAI
jgi:hypothetical protein